MKQNCEILRIGRVMPRSVANGPGQRFTIWFQGCLLHCKGCYNPEFQPLEGGMPMTTDELLKAILSTPGIEGVTYTGGEPFLQAEALVGLSSKIRSHGLSIVAYSGYTMEHILKEIPGGKRLLSHLDILIDGEYDASQRASLLWRGSRNQRVRFLSDRYQEYRPLVEKEGEREVEIIVGDSELSMTGFYDEEIWERLMERMRRGSEKGKRRDA